MMTKSSLEMKSASRPSLLAIARLRLEPVNQIDDVVETPARAVADQGAGKCDPQVGLSRPGPADQNDVVLLGEERACRELPHQPFIDGCAGEVEVFDVLGQRQLGQCDLVFDRPSLLLGDLGLKQVADDLRRLMLALDAGGHDFVIGAAHAIELQRAHHVEDVRTFHISLPS